MNIGALTPQAEALKDAVRVLERSLSDTRVQWEDQARHAFDRRLADPIVSGARQTVNQLTKLAQDLTAALRLLDCLDK